MHLISSHFGVETYKYVMTITSLPAIFEKEL